MKDKNGIKLHAGDIVEIKNAYFKNDNGFWYVEQDGSNKAYLSDDSELTLKKIGKTGKISTAKYSTSFYPLVSFTNDRVKRYEANAWNAEHATIEKVDTVDQSQVIAAFQNELNETKESYNWHEIRGYGSAWLDPLKNNIEYLERSLARLTA